MMKRSRVWLVPLMALTVAHCRSGGDVGAPAPGAAGEAGAPSSDGGTPGAGNGSSSAGAEPASGTNGYGDEGGNHGDGGTSGGGADTDAGAGSGPSFDELDSDGDGIHDADEGRGGALDTDDDGTPDYLDDDSDDDCRSDAAEGTADEDEDGRPNQRDRDSDGDRLADELEDTNCNGTTDEAESAADDVDTDADAATDLVEQTLGTDPSDESDNPQSDGAAVSIVPFGPRNAAQLDVAFTTRLSTVDVYVLLDRSASMSTELNSVKNSLSSFITQLQCPPLGSGDPSSCVADLWAGAGTFGYSGSGVDAYRNVVDLQPSPSFSTLPTSEPGGCCAEVGLFALYSTVSGQGSLASGCAIAGVTPRSTCLGSAAASGGFDSYGYPCFRSGAVPVILLATDEAPLSAGDTNNCPAWETIVKPALLSRGAKLIGISGSGSTTAVVDDLKLMATSTGAVDGLGNGAPLVFDGSDASAATAISNGVKALVSGLPLDVSLALRDDPADAVDAIAAFVGHSQTLQLGSVECANGLNEADTNGDTFPDAYRDVKPNTPLCFRLLGHGNASVPETDAAQVFAARADAVNDWGSALSSRELIFIVPPKDPDAAP
jgi:hypothetical protein